MKANENNCGDAALASPLPDGWEAALLSQIAHLQFGQSPPSSSYNSSGDGTPFFQGKAEFGDRYPTVKKWCTEPTRIAELGDILLSVRAPVGPTNVAPYRCGIGRGLASIRPHPDIPTDYVLYFLRHIAGRLAAQGSGTTFAAITKQVVEAIEVPIAPQSTRSRIVSKIDELFSEIEEGERALERVQKLVERYRQSLLKAAVTGELTREWREERKNKLESGEDRLKDILKTRRGAWERAELEKMKKKGIQPRNGKWKEKYREPDPPNLEELPRLPNGWVWVTLEQLSTKIVDGTHHTPNYEETGVAFLSVKDIRDDAIHFDDCKFISHAAHDELTARCSPERGDLLVTKSGTIGRTAVIYSERPFSLFVSVALVKPVLGVSGELLKIGFDGWFQTVNVANDITGTAIKNLHLIDLKAVCVPLMSIEEQHELLSRLAERQSMILEAKASAQGAARKSFALRQSVLGSAFSGSLVRQEPAEEPASALLARIAAERSAESKGKRVQVSSRERAA